MLITCFATQNFVTAPLFFVLKFYKICFKTKVKTNALYLSFIKILRFAHALRTERNPSKNQDVKPLE